MLEHVSLTPDAQRQYDELCRAHRRAREALDGALRRIGYTGRLLPFLPGTSLRFVETRSALHSPAMALYFVAEDDCLRVLEMAEIEER